MLRLFVDTIGLDLFPETAIDIEWRSNIFNLEVTEGTYTYEFDLPASPINAQVFGHPDAVQSLISAGKYADRSARLECAEWADEGKFRLTYASTSRYKGTFRAKSGDVSEFGSMKLRDFLADWDFDLQTNFITGVAGFWVSPTGTVAFPTMKVGNRIVNVYNAITGFLVPRTTNENILVPIVRVRDTIQEILKRMGYTVTRWWTNDYPQLDRLFSFNDIEWPADIPTTPQTIQAIDGRTGLPFTLTVDSIGFVALKQFVDLSIFVPDITVKQYLDAVRNTFGLIYSYDSTYKTVEIRSLKGIIESKVQKDWTEYAEQGFELEPIAYEGYTFGWTKDGNDKELEGEPEQEPSSLLQTAGGLPDPGEQEDGDTILLLKENKYVRAGISRRTQFREWQHLAYAQYDYVRDAGGKEVRVAFSPLQTDQQLRYRSERPGELIRRTSDGKLRIVHLNTIRGANAMIALKNAQYHPNDTYYFVVEDGDNYADLEIPHAKDETGINWIRRETLPYPIPTYGNPAKRIANGQAADAPPPRFLFYHGTFGIGGGQAIPYASDGGYDPLGGVIGELNLRWQGFDGLIETCWISFLEMMADAEQATVRMMIPSHIIRQHKEWEKVRIRDSVFFVRRISAQMTHAGISKQKVELIKAGTAASIVRPPLPIPVEFVFKINCTPPMVPVTFVFKTGCNEPAIIPLPVVPELPPVEEPPQIPVEPAPVVPNLRIFADTWDNRVTDTYKFPSAKGGLRVTINKPAYLLNEIATITFSELPGTGTQQLWIQRPAGLLTPNLPVQNYAMTSDILILANYTPPEAPPPPPDPPAPPPTTPPDVPAPLPLPNTGSSYLTVEHWSTRPDGTQFGSNVVRNVAGTQAFTNATYAGVMAPQVRNLFATDANGNFSAAANDAAAVGGIAYHLDGGSVFSAQITAGVANFTHWVIEGLPSEALCYTSTGRCTNDPDPIEFVSGNVFSSTISIRVKPARQYLLKAFFRPGTWPLS